jgi:DNA-binding Xre family transcriptional regulator
MELLEKIRIGLRDRKTSAVVAATGIHGNTIRAIRNGSRRNVKWDTLKALAEYLGVE